MELNKAFFIKRVLPVVLGGLLGYGYYYYIGCYSGSCPITGNPFISTMYGALLGGIIALPAKKKEQVNPQDK